MSLRILNAGPDPGEVSERIRRAIEAALPGAEVEVLPGSPGHFEIRVRSSEFEGKSKVRQHQLVYGAIRELMGGAEPPVHAVDRLECAVP